MEKVSHVSLIECPRDAMQGWEHFIPTEMKIDYLNLLLQVGFDTLDFGSFVSPEYIPQMADTKEIIPRLQLENTQTKLLAIVVNERGGREAAAFDEITYLGYPFSISETFQKRNTHMSIEESFDLVKRLFDLCVKKGKELVLYISMGFGNPYNDPYSEHLVGDWVGRMVDLGIKIISLADTVGVADPKTISDLYAHLIPLYPHIEFGGHFHSRPNEREEKIAAAFNNGCKRFDGAMQGYGGCPMAEDELVGNMATEFMIAYFQKRGIKIPYNKKAFAEAMLKTNEVFS